MPVPNSKQQPATSQTMPSGVVASVKPDVLKGYCGNFGSNIHYTRSTHSTQIGDCNVCVTRWWSSDVTTIDRYSLDDEADFDLLLRIKTPGQKLRRIDSAMLLLILLLTPGEDGSGRHNYAP